MRGKSKTVSDPTHLIWFSKSYGNSAYGCNCASLRWFEDIMLRNSWYPTFFILQRENRFACKFRVLRKMRVSEQASGPLIFRCSSPTTSLKNRKKNRFDIFVCKFWRYLNKNSAYRNTRASANDWKRRENRKATTMRVGWSRVNSIKFEGHVTLWSCLVALCNKKVPYSVHWLCFGILYGSQVKQLLYLCTLVNDYFFFLNRDWMYFLHKLRNEYLNIIRLNFVCRDLIT